MDTGQEEDGLTFRLPEIREPFPLTGCVILSKSVHLSQWEEWGVERIP